MSESTEKGLETVKKPLYATVGAGDAVVQAFADVVAKARERAENTSTDVSGRVEEARERFAALPADLQEQIESLRERLAGLPSELPEELAELREKFTVEELRAVAERYLKVALDLYADLAERGEETVERLRTRPVVEERIGRVEGLVDDALARTKDVREQATKLANKVTGRAEDAADDAVEKVEEAAAAVKKAVAKKAPAKKAAPAKAPAKKAPAKKAPAKKSTS